MKKVIATWALTVAAIFAIGTAVAPSASASTKPVVYFTGLGWQHGTVKPYGIVDAGYTVGTRGAEVITDGVFPVHWTRWTSTSAYGTGRKQHVTAQGYVGDGTGYVSLWGVATHNGVRYFTRMSIKGRVDGVWFKRDFLWTHARWHETSATRI